MHVAKKNDHSFSKISYNDSQYNGQKKKNKRPSNDLQHILHRKLKIAQEEPHQKQRMSSGDLLKLPIQIEYKT
jgi:hypothetical protein